MGGPVGPPIVLCRLRLRHTDGGQDLLGEEDDNAACQGQEALAPLGGVVALNGKAHLDHAPGNEDDAHSFDQAEDEGGKVVNGGDGIRGQCCRDQQRRQQGQNGKDAMDALHTALGGKGVVFHLVSSFEICWYSSSSDWKV